MTGINTLDDWRKLWSRPGAFIRNEYGEDVAISEMEAIITERQGVKAFDDHSWSSYFYTSEAEFHERNHSERGPKSLLRHRIGRHCVGHGEGTWDYIPGEFS